MPSDMAEHDAETDFLKAQTMNTEAENYGTNGAGVGQDADTPESEDYDPSTALQEDYSVPFTDLKDSATQDISHPSLTKDPSSTQRPSSPSPSNPSNSDAQVPSAAVSVPSAHVSTTTPPTQTRPRTIGGFLVDDEDDDDETGDADSYDPATALGGMDSADSADVSQRFVSQNADNVSTSHVSIQRTAQGSDSSKDVSDSAITATASASTLPNLGPISQSDGSTEPGQNLPTLQVKAAVPSVQSSVSTPTSAAPKARLPHDHVGILEDRMKEDLRGDIDAWLSLIAEHRKRNKLDEARNVYDRFFRVFPSAADQWVEYMNMESQNNDFYRLEQLFNRTLLSVPSVKLWAIYIDYIRRRNSLTEGKVQESRKTITEGFAFALEQVGIDKESSPIWTDYVKFLKSAPGNVGGNAWEDLQKMDALRKAYQKAIAVPTGVVGSMWNEYNQFEMGINKQLGRKLLQDKSPAHVTARSAFTELSNITRELVRTTLPKLPPALGFDGDVEYSKQVEIWKRWIHWEKNDPLYLKDEDPKAYKDRILYAYEQSLMALRFSPAMWFDAAEFCFQNDLEPKGNDFLKQGIDANPESCLLAFKLADRLESTTSNDEGTAGAMQRGAKVRAPYDQVLDALYDMIAKTRSREAQDIARIEQSYASPIKSPNAVRYNSDDEEISEDLERERAKTAQIDAVRKGCAAQVAILSRTISYTWIALMRAMRRIHGKGGTGEIAGARQIFRDARRRGRVTSDVYIANALIEYHCYKDPAATKIFEKGMKLFPEDENFALEYLKHLIAINDVTNARAVFETVVTRLTANADNVARAKPVFNFFHEYESHYGELAQVIKLEKRMSDLYPEDPTLKHFIHRYASPTFDPTAMRPIISPSQTRPKLLPSIEGPPSHQSSPPSQYLNVFNSPKRPFPSDDFDDDINRPKKVARGESPLKGAAGRRLDQQKRIQQVNGGSSGQGYYMPQPPPPPPLPREVAFLLSIIPRASTYKESRLDPAKMVNLIRETPLPPSNLRAPPPPPPGYGIPQMPYMGHSQYPGPY